MCFTSSSLVSALLLKPLFLDVNFSEKALEIKNLTVLILLCSGMCQRGAIFKTCISNISGTFSKQFCAITILHKLCAAVS